MRRRGEKALVAIAFLGALALRLAPIPAATQGGLRLLSPDCYGHLRRSHSVARNFPRVPVVDPYLNPPDGGVFIWPPAFDLAIGGASRLLFGRSVSLDETAIVAAALPPLLGALHLIPLYLLSRRVLGRIRARAAVAAYAVLPTAVLWSEFGHADHHVAEVLVLLSFLAAAAAALPAGRPRKVVLPALLLAAALLTWQGAVLVAGLAFAWAALALGALAPVFAALATLLGAAGTAPFVRGLTIPFSFVSFGWFQPALLAMGVVPLALLATFRAREPRTRAVAVTLFLLSAAVVLPLSRPLLGALLRGSAHLMTQDAVTAGDDFAVGGYLSYPKAFLALVFECQPLLKGSFVTSLRAAIGELSVGFVLLPFAFAAWLFSAWRKRRQGAARDRLLLLVLFGGTFLVMALFQRRNVYYLAVFSALALAELVGRASVRLPALRGVAGPVAAAALVLVFGVPSLARAARYSGAPGHDLLDLFSRLRSLDPPPVEPSAFPPPRPGALAGVMAPWGAGHMATALAERPAGADPFAYGWRRQCRLYTATDDGEALAILRSARCKYLVTIDARPVLPGYAAAAGRPPTRLEEMFIVRVHESTSPNPVPFLTLVLTSRTASPDASGRLRPRFKVFRVEGVDDEAPSGARP